MPRVGCCPSITAGQQIGAVDYAVCWRFFHWYLLQVEVMASAGNHNTCAAEASNTQIGLGLLLDKRMCTPAESTSSFPSQTKANVS